MENFHGSMDRGYEQGKRNFYFMNVKTLILFSKGECPLGPIG